MHILQRHFEILFIFLLIHTLINSHIFSTHSYFSIIKNTFPFFRPQFGNFRRGLIFSPSSERPQWSVKKGRLSERSEFEPLQRNEGREQEKKYSLDPFFWYLFFRIKTKEKYIPHHYTQKTLNHFANSPKPHTFVSLFMQSLFCKSKVRNRKYP